METKVIDMPVFCSNLKTSITECIKSGGYQGRTCFLIHPNLLSGHYFTKVIERQLQEFKPKATVHSESYL